MIKLVSILFKMAAKAKARALIRNHRAIKSNDDTLKVAQECHVRVQAQLTNEACALHKLGK